MFRSNSLSLYLFTLLLVISAQPVLAQKTWDTLSLNTAGARMDDLFFIDDSTGWAVNGSGQVFKTTDQGDNWQLLMDTSFYYFRSVRFFNHDHGFIGTFDSTIFETTDGGATWSIVTNLPDTIPGVCGMHFPTDSVGYFTGVFWGSPFLLKTRDQGASWALLDMQPYFSNPNNEFNSLVDVHFFDEFTGLICGGSGPDAQGVIFRTINGGRTWDEVYRTDSSVCNGECRIWKLFFLSDDIGFATIEDFMNVPHILKTVDGGMTWTPIKVNAPLNGNYRILQTVGFVNEYIGWVGGHQNGMFATVDGGQTWTNDSIGGNLNRFVRINNGLIFSSGYTVYRYSDADAVGIRASAPPVRDHSFTVFPNPAKDEVAITYALDHPSYMQLAIYDLKGNRITTIAEGMYKLDEHHFKADISALSSGVYYISVYTNEGYVAEKLIVE